MISLIFCAFLLFRSHRAAKLDKCPLDFSIELWAVAIADDKDESGFLPMAKIENDISHSEQASELNSEVQVLMLFCTVGTPSHLLLRSYRFVQLLVFPRPYHTASFLGYAHVVSEIWLPDILEFTRPTVASRSSTGGRVFGIFVTFCCFLTRQNMTHVDKCCWLLSFVIFCGFNNFR